MSFDFKATRAVAFAALACTLVASIPAATPPTTSAPAAPAAEVDILDEVTVRATKPIPVEDFVDLPRFDSVAISPDGTRLATAWTDDNFVRQLNVMEYPSGKPLDTQNLQGQLGATDLRWVNENRVVVQTDWPQRGFRRGREFIGAILISEPGGRDLHKLNSDILSLPNPGDEMRIMQRREAQQRENERAAELRAAAQANARAIAQANAEARAQANADNPDFAAGPGRAGGPGLGGLGPVGGPGRAGGPGAGTGKTPDKNSRGPVQMIAARTGTPNQMLFQTTRSNDSSGKKDGYGAFSYDVLADDQQRVATLPVSGGVFVTGPGQQIALATGMNALDEQVVYFLPPEARARGTEWKLISSSSSGVRGLRPVAWTGNGEEYYALDGRYAETRSVVIWDAQKNSQKVIYRHPAADMDNFAVDHAGKAWIFWGTDHVPVYWYPDPAHPLAQLHQTLVKQRRDEQIDIINSTDDFATAVVRISSPRRAPVFLTMDVKEAKTIKAMNTYPKIRGTRLAIVDAIEFKARDGVRVRAYLTTPEDANDKPRKGLPLVVIAKDGPGEEGADFRYEFERQLFASRGYAVLQVNHRGTPGSGATYERAGRGKWGTTVQDDYADAVLWAIKDGVAAADHVCFYGTGFGAYSAMVAAEREPDLFKCVIGVAGIYDLPRFLDNGKKEIPLALQQAMGTTMKELDARSPINRAAQITAKVLLMHHQDDERFPLDQAVGMREALKEAGNPAQWNPVGSSSGYLDLAQRAGGYDVIFRFIDKSLGLK